MLDVFFRGIAGQMDRSLVGDVVRVILAMKKHLAPFQVTIEALGGHRSAPTYLEQIVHLVHCWLAPAVLMRICKKLHE